jgi:5'-3' exonuclease
MRSKELIDAFGFIYYNAPGEADILCAYLVNIGIAWACLSDDMDLFLYGCPRVLRNLSLLNHSVVLYDSVIILKELGITYMDLLEIAVISGTDYNTGSLSLRKTFELHNEFLLKDSDSSSFCDWLVTTNVPIEKEYNLRGSLTTHLKSHLPKQEIEYSCEYCNKKYNDKIPYAQHIRSHTQEGIQSQKKRVEASIKKAKEESSKKLLLTEKQCKVCNIIKSMNEYHAKNNAADKKQNSCKDCQYLKNKERKSSSKP